VVVLLPGEGWRYEPGLVRGRSSCSMRGGSEREREVGSSLVGRLKRRLF
jgi:hypothetical protein